MFSLVSGIGNVGSLKDTKNRAAPNFDKLPRNKQIPQGTKIALTLTC